MGERPAIAGILVLFLICMVGELVSFFGWMHNLMAHFDGRLLHLKVTIFGGKV